MISRGTPLERRRCAPGRSFADRKEVMTLTDRQILRLLQSRDETALRELTAQYGAPCRKLACRLLGSEEDAAEVWNDALLQIWSSIPPEQPRSLGAYLHTVVKRLSLNRLEQRNAQKRGGGRSPVSLDALPESLHPAGKSVEELMDARALYASVNRFLGTQPEETVTIFVHYYGNGRSIREIAEAFGITQSKVAVTLMRTRRKLWKWLDKEGRL